MGFATIDIGGGSYFPIVGAGRGGYAIGSQPGLPDPPISRYIEASGGTLTIDGKYYVRTFTSSDDLIITKAPMGVTAWYLLVAGGGAGSGGWYDGNCSGGGGAGGWKEDTEWTPSIGTFPVVIAAGGAKGVGTISSNAANAGTNGSNSTFNGNTTIGGGKGQDASAIITNMDGGSGGGSGAANGAGGLGTVGQGHNGGIGNGTGIPYRGGGGGGAGSVGGNGNLGLGAGGAGIQSSITGAALWYAAGGGGGGDSTPDNGGTGGSGIGGNGGGFSQGKNATDGTANRGAGGGSGAWITSGGLQTGGDGGNGGSGIFIFRYQFSDASINVSEATRVFTGPYAGAMSYIVSGSNLIDDILITCPDGFVMNLDGTDYNEKKITLLQSGGTVASTTIYIKWVPVTPANQAATNLTHVSTGATTVNVALSGTYVVDADAAAFITAASITDNTQKCIANLYATRTKYDSLWAKIYAMWPNTFADATKNTFNLKNPATFTKTFNGTISHDVNGVFYNGGYAQTGFVPITDSDANDFSSLAFFPTSGSGAITKVILGAVSTGVAQIRFYPFFNTSSIGIISYIYDSNIPGGGVQSPLTPDYSGLISQSQNGSFHKVYKSTTIVDSNSNTGGTRPLVELFEGAYNNNGAGAASNFVGTIGLNVIAKAVSDAEVVLLNSMAEVAALVNPSIKAKGGITLTYEGDSIMAAMGADIDSKLTADSYYLDSDNLAVSGSTISIIKPSNYMLAPARVAAVDARLNTLSYQNVLMGHEGTNELNEQLAVNSVSDSVTNTFNAYKTYYQGQAAKGFICALNSILPRSDVAANVNFETARQQVNAAILSDFNISTSVTGVYRSSKSEWEGCILCDIGNDSNIGQPGDSNDTTYYDADKLHLNSTGSAYAADNYYGLVPSIIQMT